MKDDIIFIIKGEERIGMSVYALHMASYIDSQINRNVTKIKKS